MSGGAKPSHAPVSCTQCWAMQSFPLVLGHSADGKTCGSAPTDGNDRECKPREGELLVFDGGADQTSRSIHPRYIGNQALPVKIAAVPGSALRGALSLYVQNPV